MSADSNCRSHPAASLRVRTSLALGTILLTAGCQTLVPIKADAFGKDRRAAVVLLYADKDIQAWTAPAPGYRSTDEAFDAEPVLAELHTIFIEGLSRSTHFTLVPETKVLSAAAYARAPTGPLSSMFVVPRGYKYVISESHYPLVAKEVGADMAMGFHLFPHYLPGDGVACVSLSVGIIEASGRPLWKGGVNSVSDDTSDIRKVSAARRSAIFKATMRKAMVAFEQAMTEALDEARGVGTPKR